MVDPTAAWRAEHAKFARLLSLLEEQLAVFRCGERPDYELMLDIVYYLRHYPDRYHHPREDVAFERLAQRDPSMRPRVERLLREHGIIAKAGERLIEYLREVMDGAVLSRQTVETAGATYLVYYLHHLDAEENDVIPAAARSLTPQDWQDAAAAVPAGPDPVFGEDSDAHYESLRRRIRQESRPA